MEPDRAYNWRRDEQVRLYRLLNLEANICNANLEDEDEETDSPSHSSVATISDLKIGDELLKPTNYSIFSVKGAGRRKILCSIAVHEFGLRLHLTAAGTTSTEDIAYESINHIIVAHRNSDKGQETRISLGTTHSRLSRLLLTHVDIHFSNTIQLIIENIKQSSIKALQRVEQTEQTGALVSIVSRLNTITQPEDLEIIFSRFGKIVSCRKEETCAKHNDAVIVFSSPASAIECRGKMENVLIDGSRIAVDLRVIRPPGSQAAALWRFYPIIDSIDENSRFCGVLGKDRLEFYFSDTCISSIYDYKPQIINLREVEIVHFERSFGTSGARATDIIFVMKRLWTLSEYSRKSEFSSCMVRIDGVSAVDAEKVKDGLTRRGVVFFQNEASLRWEMVLKYVVQSRKYFWEDAGWRFLAPADAKDDSSPEEAQDDNDDEDTSDVEWKINDDYVYNSADEDGEED